LFLGLIREFVELSDSWTVGDDHARLELLMAELRRYGFSGGEISQLSGEEGKPRWKPNTVLQYTRVPPWGGVVKERKLVKEREMQVLRRLARSKLSFEDVEAALKLKESVERKGSTLVDLAELWFYMSKIPVEKGEVESLVGAARLIAGKGVTPAEMEKRMLAEEKLSGEGFTLENREKLLGLCEKHGSFDSVLRRFEKFTELLDLDLSIIKAKEDLDNAISAAVKEEMKFGEYKEANKAVDALLGAGFILETITALPWVIRKSDTRENLAKAVEMCRSIQDLMAREKAYGVLVVEREKMLEGFSPYQREEFEKFLTLTTRELPPGTRTSGYSMLVNGILANYLMAARNDPELAPEIKELLANLQTSALEVWRALYPETFGDR
jgi:hypothetical protein